MILEFIERAILDPLRRCPETQILLQEHGPNFDRHLLSTVLDQGRRASDSLLTARYYAYCYMLSHHDAMKHVLSIHGDQFRSGILSHNGDLLVVDFGCGPLIAALALGAQSIEVGGAPLDCRYVGIDDNEFVLELASEFASSPVFGAGFEASYKKEWNEHDVPAIIDFARGSKGLVFVFSYFFGQLLSDESIERLARFCKSILTSLKPDHASLIYLNSLHETAGPNWVKFAKHMDVDSSIHSDNYDFRIFLGLNSKPKEFHNTKLRPSLAHSFLNLDWRRYTSSGT